MGKLDQRVAIITGGARGIGKQIALTFAAEGADIVIGDIVDMEIAANEVGKLGRKAVTVESDVTRKKEVENLFEIAVASFKKVDILVNNAGTTRNAKLLETTEEDWDFVQDVNLKGSFLCTQVAARYMTERKYGKIINMSSVAAVTSRPIASANYQCAKASVIQLTRASARELGHYGINVNVIAPGFIITEMSYLRRKPEEVQKLIEDITKQTPLGRLGTVQDVANLALFLASDDSSFITGQTLSVDGGWS